MKDHYKILIIVFSFLFAAQYFPQDIKTGKRYYTAEEMKRMCNLPFDPKLDPIIDAKEDSMYNAYLSSIKFFKRTTTPDWQSYMSDVDDQESNTNCAVYAACAAAEGQLQIMYGSRIGTSGIDLEEWIPPFPTPISSALGYIRSSKVGSEVDPVEEYPNFTGVKWTIESSTNRLPQNPSVPIQGIDRVKLALEHGPVTAQFKIYDDFGYYFSNPTAIYHVGPNSEYTDAHHAVVIVSYHEDTQNPENSYWLCKNSWGDWWADNGYFRIGFGECGIETIDNRVVYVNESCYAKLIPNLKTFQNGMSSSWVDNEWAYILNNTTINSGVTVTIPSDAYITFSNSVSLAVNGTLNANGVTFTRNGASGNWYGIRFNSGSSGSLSYCTIEYAHCGIYCNQSLPNITYCTISNNITGIELYNTGVRTNNIGNNTIEDNQYYGIYMSYSSPRNIYENTIDDNGQAGIYCVSYSTPYIYNNTITNNGAAGITCAVFSPGHLGSYSSGAGNNHITGNYWGVGCGYESDVIIGTTSAAGYNSIHDNINYEVLGEYDSYVMAENNWWNRTPPTYPNYYYAGDFSTSSGGTIDYIPALTSNPLSALMKVNLSNLEVPNSDHSEISFVPDVSGNNSFFDSELRDALDDLLNGKYEEAINKYAQRLKEETNKITQKYILRRIAECYNLSERKGFGDFLNYEVRNNLSKNDELYATTLFLENMFLIQENRFEQAIANFNTLKTDFSGNESIVKPALFNLICLSYKEEDNSTKGKGYLDELKSLFPNDELTRQAMLLSGEIDNIFTPEIKKDAVVEVKTPDNFSLLGNYPNPFNPSTVIKFSVPVTSNVKLTIYNIMGQEIKSFESDGVSVGTHSFNWNGRNKNDEQVSSGIYIYRLRAIGSNGEVFERSAKMILLR